MSNNGRSVMCQKTRNILSLPPPSILFATEEGAKREKINFLFSIIIYALEMRTEEKIVSDSAREAAKNAGPQQKYDYVCKLIKFVTK